MGLLRKGRGQRRTRPKISQHKIQRCHEAIFEKYEQTPMARASGSASDGLIPADLKQSTTGVEYRIRREGEQVVLDYERPALESGEEQIPAIQGKRVLRYFIGSGLQGRTYLFERDGYWFEAPINWYAQKRVWDMAPNFLQAAEMPLTLPVDPGCLRCHTSGAQTAMAQARNKYAGAPFLHSGITCEVCHGDASAHVDSDGHVSMAKIDELPSDKRDSICLSCHLEGQAAIVHPGKKLVDFRPGDSIWDYASFYVHVSEQGSDGRATSQWEALLGSACKRASGDRLTCTTCHDPHGSDTRMTQTEKVNWYRARCLSCHETPAEADRPSFSRTHYPQHRDCTTCHMQRASSTDIAHEQVTDHRIVTRFPGKVIPPATTGPLVEVGSERIAAPAVNRDLGLAYAQFAALGDHSAQKRALQILKQAEQEPTSKADDPLHAQLGFLEQVNGQIRAAAQEYEAALRVDPDDAFAAGNLGTILAQFGHPATAAQLWTRVLARNPGEKTIGINLATVECGMGQLEAALATLEQVLEFEPDDRQAAALQMAIRERRRPCGR
jgi:predicted CXXCH cytochrome family protein